MANRRTRSIEDYSSFYLSTFFKARVLLIWTKRTTSTYGKLSVNIIREVCQFMGYHPQLALCRTFDLAALDLTELHCRVFNLYDLRLPRSIPPECVCIGGNEVFLCGGGKFSPSGPCPSSAATFVIACGQASQLCDMKTARLRHGLSYHDSTRRVFAFGGHTAQAVSNTCEVYCLATDTWSSLPNMMEAKEKVSTCVYKEKVYLCGRGGNSCELFTIATKKFALLPVEIAPGKGMSVVVIWKGQLIVIKKDCIRRWNAGSLDFIGESTLSRQVNSKSVCVANDSLFILDHDKLSSLDLETETFHSTYPYQ